MVHTIELIKLKLTLQYKILNRFLPNPHYALDLNESKCLTDFSLFPGY